MAESSQENKFLTQRELAKRWHVSQSCVKNWREKGFIPYLRFPGSTRILYPVEGIEEAERKFTRSTKEVRHQAQQTEIKRKKPDISATRKEWRI